MKKAAIHAVLRLSSQRFFGLPNPATVFCSDSPRRDGLGVAELCHKRPWGSKRLSRQPLPHHFVGGSIRVEPIRHVAVQVAANLGIHPRLNVDQRHA